MTNSVIGWAIIEVCQTNNFTLDQPKSKWTTYEIQANYENQQLKQLLKPQSKVNFKIANTKDLTFYTSSRILCVDLDKTQNVKRLR